LFFITQIGFAQFTYQKTDFQTSVYDYAKVLSASESTRRKLVQYADNHNSNCYYYHWKPKRRRYGILLQNGDNGESVELKRRQWSPILLLKRKENMDFTRLWSWGTGWLAGIGGEITRKHYWFWIQSRKLP
jgi:uncharacterized protein